jgi:hypothetical protein
MTDEHGPLSVEHELTVLEAMAAELEPYLKADILYWQLSPQRRISPPPPLLTVGGALLREQRLEAMKDEMKGEQQARLEAAREEFEEAMTEWKAHAAQKIVRELGARVNSWRWYVAECQTRNRSCITSYPSEAEKRTILALLLDRAAQYMDVGEFRERVRELDAQFKGHFESGAFVWDERLQAAFPQERFWWLYGRPVVPER